LASVTALSDAQRADLLAQGTAAINDVTLNYYGDLAQAQTDVDAAYDSVISQIAGLTLKNEFPITVDEKTFPDENLRNEVLYQLQEANGGVPTNKMSYEFAGSFSSLTLPSSLNIENFKGLQYFYNLEKIDISGSNVADWSPLAALPKLKEIRADVLGPDVSAIDLSNFPVLTKLQVSGTAFTMDSAGTALTGGTGITKITSGPTMTDLLINRLPALQSVDTSQSADLTYLSASNMDGLKNLDLTNNAKLTELYAYDNPNLAGLDLSNQYSLQTLAIFGDNLTDSTLNWGYIGGSLQTLSAGDNPALTTLPTSLYSLQSLSINKTAIRDISEQVRAAGTNLTLVSASDINGFVFPDFTQNPNLEGLTVANDGLTAINLQKPAYETDEYGYPKYDENYNMIPKLDANGKQLYEPMAPNLQSVIFSNNAVTEIDLSDMAYLSTIQGDHNALTSVDVSGDTRLSVLLLNDNELTSLDLRDNTLLSGYMLGNNHLATLDLTTNVASNHQYGDSTYQTVSGKMYQVDGKYYVNLTDVVGKDNLQFVAIPGADASADTMVVATNSWQYDNATGLAKWVGEGVPTALQYNFSAGAGQFMPVVVSLTDSKDLAFKVNFAVAQPTQGSVKDVAQTVQVGQAVKTVPTPVAASGYVFDHWENKKGVTVDPKTFHVSGDDTFYAIFRSVNAQPASTRAAEDTVITSAIVNADGTVTISGNTNLATNQIVTANDQVVTVNADGTFTYVVPADQNTGSMDFITSNYTGTRSASVTATWENPTPVRPELKNDDLKLTTATTEAQSFTHTTHFVYADGSKAADDQVVKTVYTRQATTDITGKVTYTDWRDAQGHLLDNAKDTVATVIVPATKSVQAAGGATTQVETQVVVNSTRYVYANGQKAAESEQAKTIVSRVKTVATNGKVTYSAWEDAQGRVVSDAELAGTVTTVVVASDNPVLNTGTQKTQTVVNATATPAAPTNQTVEKTNRVTPKAAQETVVKTVYKVGIDWFWVILLGVIDFVLALGQLFKKNQATK
jgi:hypothetical protein